MEIKLLADGKYQNKALRAEKKRAGDTLDVHEWYGRSLIADGMAEPIEAVEEAPKSDEGGQVAANDTTTSEGEVIAQDDVLAITRAMAALIAVKGIGEETAEKLVQAGIRSVEELAAADTAELAAKLGTPAKTVAKWQEAAKQ